jgi:hypothetical protein
MCSETFHILLSRLEYLVKLAAFVWSLFQLLFLLR